MSDREPFSLDELEPEPLTVTLAGRVYPVRSVAHMGPLDYARLKRLQQQIARAGAAVQGDEPDEKHGQALADAADQIVALIVPELPPEALPKVSFAKKMQLLAHWQQQQPKADAPGEAPRQ